MGWLYLFAAGLLEIGWAVGLKHSAGATRLAPTMLTLAAMAASLVLLAIAVRTLPLGTAYAIWTGIGVVGTAAVGIFVYGEPAGVLRLVSLVLILVGVAGVKFEAS